jgi:FAD/FMN-containing dehydrogenase
MWPDPADNEQNTQWVRDYYDATAPLSEEGGYVNFMADDDQGRVQSNYKGNYDRLAQLKREYDPGNLFRFNQNIQPA